MKTLSLMMVIFIGMACFIVPDAIAGAGAGLQLPDFGFQWPAWVVKLGGYYQTVVSMVGTFAVVAAVTPTPKDDGYARTLKLIVDWLGANFWHAKNAD